MAEQEILGHNHARIENHEIREGVQLRGVYDGICYYVLNDGCKVNRFPEDHYAYAATEAHLALLRGEGHG